MAESGRRCYPEIFFLQCEYCRGRLGGDRLQEETNPDANVIQIRVAKREGNKQNVISGVSTLDSYIDSIVNIGVARLLIPSRTTSHWLTRKT